MRGEYRRIHSSNGGHGSTGGYIGVNEDKWEFRGYIVVRVEYVRTRYI